jgi:uncharacterized protein (DUF1501 family)
MRRRQFLGSALAGLGVGLAPRVARAAVSGGDLRFVFVLAYGGWDPTRVFVPAFGFDHVDMEPDAGSATAGGLTYVDHAERPSVRAFLDDWHASTLFMNGILVPSVAHPASLRRLLTGATADGISDWPARIAAAKAASFTLPHVVISGPSYPGILGEVVTRTGTSGQLAALLAGDVAENADIPIAAPTPAAEARIDRYLDARTAELLARATNARDQTLLTAIASGLTRGAGLKASRDTVDWASTTSFSEQAALAVDILAMDVARCVTLAYDGELWDSHTSNDWNQTRNFEGLFAELRLLMEGLATTPGSLGGTLADQTVVVVLSEMGRAPLLNGSEGKDHWPYTSAMIVGPAFTGDRVVGGWDDNFFGLDLDLATGEPSASGSLVGSEGLGATLLASADVDPEDAGGEVVTGILLG